MALNKDLSIKEDVEGGSITTHYPKGKLNIYDEGAIKVAMVVHNNRMIIDFGKELKWIGLGKDELETWIRIMQKNLEKLT